MFYNVGANTTESPIKFLGFPEFALSLPGGVSVVCTLVIPNDKRVFFNLL